MKTSMNIKVESDVRDEAKQVFAQLGLDMTTAVNMFLLASIREGGLPFNVSVKSAQERSVEQFVSAKLRLAEQQEQAGQLIDFDSFAQELKSKYAD